MTNIVNIAMIYLLIMFPFSQALLSQSNLFYSRLLAEAPPTIIITDTIPYIELTKSTQYPYSLIGNNQWNQFPFLVNKIQLKQQRYVGISYVISNPSKDCAQLYTRLTINSQNIKEFRAVSGATYYHTNAASSFLFLGPGDYQIKVQYKTPGQFSNIVEEDWTSAFLSIYY